MDTLTALTTRTSSPKLKAPGPSAADLDQMIFAALRAPDHGKLRPWRFMVLIGDQRERLGVIMADALQAREPDAPRPLIDREREKPLRAPAIVVAVARVDPDHPKIPAIEQLLATAAAAQNILLAAHDLGYGAIWRTGESAYDDTVKRRLGLNDADEIVGFLYLGTPEFNKPLAALDPADYMLRMPT